MENNKLYIKPNTVEAALTAASNHNGDFHFLAGGTDVMVNKFQGNENSACLIDITGIEELKKITIEGNNLCIGSLVKLDDLAKHRIIATKFPALLEAAHAAASPIIRKSATIGGNILCENRCVFFNQSEWWRTAVGYCLKCDGDICIATSGTKACFSKFVSDTAPVLISVGAMLEIADEHSEKMAELESIYSGDGINPRTLSKTSLIKRIIIPLDFDFKIIFKKLRPRAAVDFTSLTTAVSMRSDGAVKVVIGGVDPKPVVIKTILTDNIEDYIKAALRKSRIVDNDFYSRKYRREMIRVFLTQSFRELGLQQK